MPQTASAQYNYFSSVQFGSSKMNNTERQTFFEQLAYPLLVQKANYQAYQRQNKADAIARMAEATRLGMLKIGIDLQQLDLADRGFKPR
jgi:hypothetical protein